MRAVIFVNGEIADYADARSWLDENDYLVAANGGSAHCLAMGLTPDVVVGDLDSIDSDVQQKLEAANVSLERHPAAKDQTDLELALERAILDGADEVMMLGAMGGRVDQTVANLLILVQRSWPALIRLVANRQVACVLRGGETLELEGPIGSTVSVIPLSLEVRGITYSGLTYPLIEHTLTFGSTRGISNTIACSPATIEVERGTLLIVQSID